MRAYSALLLSLLLLGFSCQRKLGSVEPVSDSSSSASATPPKEVSEHPAAITVAVLPKGETPANYQPFPASGKSQGLPLPSAVNTCETVGEVWDFDGSDGCGLVIQTTEGHLFAVAGLPQGYELERGSRIRFGFRYAVQEESRPCSTADAMVRITCMQVLRGSSGFPRPFVCQSFDEPSAWLQDLVIEHRANYVTRFPWKEDRFVYLFETSDGQYLYDCQGFLLCQPKSNCLRFIEDFSLGKLIYEG